MASKRVLEEIAKVHSLVHAHLAAKQQTGIYSIQNACTNMPTHIPLSGQTRTPLISWAAAHTRWLRGENVKNKQTKA